MSVNKADNSRRNEDVADAYGYGANSPEHISVLHTAPTERYATHYKMDHRKRGLAVIFNHEFFAMSELETRTGTNIDCENLVSTLEGLGFEVNVFANVPHIDIARNLERVAGMNHSHHDCLVIVVLSHGELGQLYAFDTSYKAESVWSYFTSDKCPSLAGKPKLFFIQACQGTKRDGGSTLRERTQSDGRQAQDKSFRIPIHADFLIVYSTIPVYCSSHAPMTGSWFIQALCMELREHGTSCDMLSLLTLVSRRIAIDFRSMTHDQPEPLTNKQVPCITSTLTRLIQFTPRSSEL